MTYKSVGFRTNYSANDQKLIGFINANINKKSDLDLEQIIELGLSMTSSQLNYTLNRNDIDPNKLISSKTAHCVGYASFFATTCNFIFKKYNLDDKWIAKPQIGQLYFLGINAHQYFNSSFFKDHDFVTFENNETGEVIAVDPTIHDYLLIDYITFYK